MTTALRTTAIEYHPCGAYEYTVSYYGQVAGIVGRYPRQRTWYFRNDLAGAYGETSSRERAALDLLSVPAVQTYLNGQQTVV